MLESSVVANQRPVDGAADAARRAPQTIAEPFVFVPITSGEAAKGRGAAKRIVRAHVTRVQHAKTSTLHSHNLEKWMVKPYIHRNTTAAKRRPPSNGSVKSRHGSDETKDELSAEEKNHEVAVVPKLATGGSHDDPFWTYPVEYQPYLAPIFAHCEYRHALTLLAYVDLPRYPKRCRRNPRP